MDRTRTFRPFFILLLASGAFAQETEKPLVAVLPFSSRILDSSAIDGLMSAMNSELVNTGAFRVMERSQMDGILREQGFRETGACDGADCAVEAGKILSVDEMVLGSVGKVGNTYTVSVRLVDVGTGEVLKSVTKNSRAEVDAILTDILPQVANDLVSGHAKDTTAKPTSNKPIAEPASSDTAEDTDTADDDAHDGWQDWTATIGVSAQQPQFRTAAGDTVQRGATFTFGREWVYGNWTLGPQIGLDGTKTQYPFGDSSKLAASFSMGLDWSPAEWFTASATPYYTTQTGTDDLGGTGSLRGTYEANKHISFDLGLASTWSRLQHGSAFVEPGVDATSSWVDAGAELDLGTQWESFSQLVDSTVVRKIIARDTVVQAIHPDSGEVPMLQATVYLKLHGKSWSIKPYWKFQGWQKTSTDTTAKGKPAKLTQHQYTTDLGLDGTVRPTSWLDLDLDLSHGTQTGTTQLNGHTLTQKSNPRLAKKYPWLKSANLPTGWTLSLSATTSW